MAWRPVPGLDQTCPYTIRAPTLPEVNRDGVEACAWPMSDMPLRHPCTDSARGESGWHGGRCLAYIRPAPKQSEARIRPHEEGWA